MYNYLTAAPAGIPDLKSVLNLHVATAVVYSNELAATQNVPTVNGEVLFIDAIESCDSIAIGLLILFCGVYVGAHRDRQWLRRDRQQRR